MPAALLRPSWPGWAVALVTAAVTAVVLTTGILPVPARDALHLGVPLAGVVAAGLTLHRRHVSGAVDSGWLLVVAGLGVLVLGDGVWLLLTRNGIEAHPSFADIGYLTGVAGLVAGALILVQARRPDHEPFIRYDAAVLAGAVATLLLVLVLEPAMTATDLTGWLLALALSYTVLVSLLALAVGREVAGGTGTPVGLRLLFGGLGLLFFGGALYHLQQATGTYGEWGFVDAAFLVAMGLVSAAVLHPSATAAASRTTDTATVGRVRVVVLTFAATTPVLLLIWQHLTGRRPDVLLLGGIAAVLFTAVIGRTWHLVGAVQELAQLRSERRLDALVRHGADAIVVIDEAGQIRMSSDALSRVWASPVDRSDIESWVHPEDRAPFAAWRRRLASTRRGHRSVSKVRLLKPHGEGFAEVVGVNLLHDDEVRGMVLTIRDVSDRVALEARLRRQADRDDLTGLAKRAVFVRVVENRLGTASRVNPLAVMFFDLDDFKLINDTLGHADGDAVLIEVADRLRSQLPEDGLAARFGGDEFAAVFDAHGGHARVRTIADRISRTLEFPVQGLAGDIPVTVSIGVSVAEAPTTADVLLRQADIAMYAAKRAGKSGVEFHRPEMESGRALID